MSLETDNWMTIYESQWYIDTKLWITIGSLKKKLDTKKNKK